MAKLLHALGFPFKDRARVHGGVLPNEPSGALLFAYGIDPTDFYLRCVRTDGTVVWNIYADDVWSGHPTMADTMWSWPGYNGGNLAPSGYYLNMMYLVWEADGAGFYRVGLDGSGLGQSMVLDPQGGNVQWGQYVAEASDGKRYATYWADSGDYPVVAAWSDDTTMLWQVTRYEFASRPTDDITSASAQLAPGEEVLVVAFTSSFLAGIDTVTGEVLWEFQLPDGTWLMDSSTLIEFAPDGRLYHIGQRDPGGGTGWREQGTVWLLDFSDGYDQEPSIVWQKRLGTPFAVDEGYSQVVAMTTLPSGGVVVSYMEEEEGVYDRQYLLTRLDSDGEVVWEVNIDDQRPDHYWDSPYNPIAHLNGRIYGTLRDAAAANYEDYYKMTRWNVEDGSLAEGGEWPIEGMWAIGLYAKPAVAAEGTQPVTTTDDALLTTSDGLLLTTNG